MDETDYSELVDCTCFNIRKASRMITQLYDHALSPVGLKITQFNILAVLTNTGELTISLLADRLGMDRTTLTRGLVRLETDTLIVTQAGDDARQRKVQLAQQGRALLDAALPHWKRAQQKMQDGFGASFVTFLKTLDQSAKIAASERD